MTHDTSNKSLRKFKIYNDKINVMLNGIDEEDKIILWGAEGQGKTTLSFIMTLSILKNAEENGEELPCIIYIDTQQTDKEKEGIAHREIRESIMELCKEIGLKNEELIASHFKIISLDSEKNIRSLISTVTDLMNKYKIASIIIDPIHYDLSYLLDHIEVMTIDYKKPIIIVVNEVRASPFFKWGNDEIRRYRCKFKEFYCNCNKIIRVTKKFDNVTHTVHLTGTASDQKTYNKVEFEL